MTGYFELKSLNDTVTTMNGVTMNGMLVSDLVATFPQWFKIVKDSNGIEAQLQCKKYNGNPLVLTLDNNGTTYTAPSIRLFGGRPRPPKPTA